MNSSGGKSAVEMDFIGCIPVLPEVMERFIALTRELNTSKSSYANILLQDPILSSRIFSYINLVLNPSNSGYLSVNKGVSVMGLQKFKNVVLVFSLFPVFWESNCLELFKYSLLTAYCSKDIAMQFNFINPNDAFLLGFLHDIGKIAMKNKFGEKYKIAADDIESDIKIYSPESEVQEFKYSHADLGEYICRIWNLPIVVTDSIKFHHFPLDAMLPQAASIIYLADVLAQQNSKITKETQKVFQYMRLSQSDLKQYVSASKKKLLPFFEILDIT